MNRSELLALKRDLAALIEQQAEAQALLQRLQTERAVLEAELRGHECARRRAESRRRRERRKKP